jgi:hypothetical protein
VEVGLRRFREGSEEVQRRFREGWFGEGSDLNLL